MTGPQDVGVAIVNYRTARALRGLLDRWSGELPPQSRFAGIVIIDNDPGDLDVASWPDLPVTYRANAGNQGYAAAVNAACRLLTAPYVLLLNPDAEIAPEGIRRMAAVLDVEPSVGAVAPLHVNRDNKVTNPYRRIPSWLDLAANATRLQHYQWAKQRVRNYHCQELDEIQTGWPPMPVEQPPASCMLLRRCALIGEVMDGRFPIVFNDVDLSTRLRAGGWTTLIEPAIQCRHEPATSTRYLGVIAEAEYVVAEYRYLRKWNGRTRAELFRSLVLSELGWGARGRGARRDECRLAIGALIRDQSIFDFAGDGDPVRPYWPPELAENA